MTTVDMTGPATSSGSVPRIPPSGRTAQARFLGSERRFFGLLVRGSVPVLLTLGIYRFWLTTDVRRFLWSNVELAGDGLEYTGTARELLIGFLMAIALLAPINGLIVLAGFLDGRLLTLSGPLGLALLTVLGQFAVYRARRYRLSRTVFRSIRLYQTGSAWRYAFMSIGWWIVIGLTCGLGYPWALASLERYKLRHTHYGTLDGRFVGSGTHLFVRGFALWLIAIAPLVASVATSALAIRNNWGALTLLIANGGSLRAWLNDVGPVVAGPFVIAVAGLAWAVCAVALLYPLFQAIVLRWWISGLRLGPIVATSRLRAGQIYRVYLRLLGFAMLFAIGAGAVAAILVGLFDALGRHFGASAGFQVIAIVAGVGGYAVTMLAYSAIHQATVVIRFWRLSFEMTDFSGVAALDHVEARGEAASPFGEGLAGVLDVGGL
jgi:uncharacterized membrane protein YjgN (DUF898 family)